MTYIYIYIQNGGHIYIFRGQKFLDPVYIYIYNATQKLHQTKYYNTLYTDKVYPIHFAWIRFYICIDQLNFINFARMWTKVEYLPRAQQTLQYGTIPLGRAVNINITT